VKSLNPSLSGTETWLLRRFHGEKDRRKSDSKNFFEKHSACIVCSEKDRRKCDLKKLFEKHSACIVCSEKDRRKCDLKKYFEKHSACVVCSEKIAIECRQVSTLEHEVER
jgi:hypothetical protein